MTALEETVTQLQADNKELMSRNATIEEILTAHDNGSGSSSSDDGTASFPLIACYKHDTTDIVVKSIMTAAIITGLVAVEFI